MSRNRRSAKQAGASFERSIANYLAAELNDENIDRQVRTNPDTGDIANVRFRGHRIAIEAKNCAKTDLPAWTREARTEARNLGALMGAVVFKRHGVAAPGQQWVAMTLDDFISLFTELPPEEL